MAVYKRVLLVGKGIDNPINKNQCNKDCIIIGNKESGFSLNALNVLKGKIDFTTRIYINAHGWNYSDIHFLQTYKEYIPTIVLLSELTSLANSNPLYVNLYSCYAGTANKDFSVLSEGSILVTHGLDSHVTLMPLNNLGLLQSFSKDRNSDHFVELAQDILLGSMQSSTINFRSNNKAMKFDFAKNLNILELSSNPHKVISEELESLKKQAELENIKFEFPTFSDEQVSNFVKGYLIHQATIGSDELKVFLKNPSISKEALKLLLNDNAFNYSALIITAQEGHKEVAKLLVESGADFNFITNDGVTPLNIAASKGHKEIVEILVGVGADLNLAKNNGVTALFVAAQEGHKEVVEILVGAGADLNLANKNFVKPLYHALCHNKDSIAKLLFDKHMETELNAQVFIIKTTEVINYACPSKLSDFNELVANYQLEHAHNDL